MNNVLVGPVPAAGPRPPRSVTVAFCAMLTALGFGIAETAVRSAEQLAQHTAPTALTTGCLVRAGIYGAVLLVSLRMLRGDRWARIALTVGVGVVGTASLLVEPLTALFAADDLTRLLPGTTLPNVLVALARLGHLGAVSVAIPAMNTAPARAWSAPRRRLGSAAPGSPTHREPGRRIRTAEPRPE